MIYFKKIKLATESLIRSFVLKHVEQTVPSNILDTAVRHRVSHEIPKLIQTEINNDLAKYGIPPIWYAQTYLMKKNTIQPIHVDGNNMIGLVNCAINIPIKGFKNSRHVFYKGNYDLFFDDLGITKHFSLNWNEPEQIADELEIDSPYLLRVDHPHSAISADEDRWTFTMRFKGNPSFDEIVKNLS